MKKLINYDGKILASFNTFEEAATWALDHGFQCTHIVDGDNEFDIENFVLTYQQSLIGGHTALDMGGPFFWSGEALNEEYETDKYTDGKVYDDPAEVCIDHCYESLSDFVLTFARYADKA